MNILVVTYWSYKDALIQTYTLPYVKIMQRYLPKESKVFLFTLEQERFQMEEEEWEQVEKKLNQENIYLIRHAYVSFGLSSILNTPLLLLKLIRTIRQQNISVIHAWCTPGGAIGYLLTLFTRKPLYVDSYEPHAESSVENGSWKRNSLAFKILFNLEKRLTRKAKYFISTTEGMYEYAQKAYGVEIPRSRFFVKPACVNMDLFQIPSEKEVAQLKKTLQIDPTYKVGVYAGKLGGIYLKEEVFSLLKTAYDFWEEKFVFVMLTNTAREEIEALCSQVGLPAESVLSKFVFHQDVPKYLSIGDFGITPVKPIPSKRYCTPIKDGEYWALGLPVIICPNISDDSEIIEHNGIGSILQGFSNSDYKQSIREIDELLTTNSREALQRKIRQVALTYRSFSIAEKIYQSIYEK